MVDWSIYLCETGLRDHPAEAAYEIARRAGAWCEIPQTLERRLLEASNAQRAS